jgi:RNA polymerase sigma factor (sigma-70 family)
MTVSCRSATNSAVQRPEQLQTAEAPEGCGDPRHRGAPTPVERLRRCSDEQLVERFRAGADEAFGVIHERYRLRLRAYVGATLGRGSKEDVEDLVQDVFERAAWTVRTGNPPVGLRAWLYGVAHNRCIDELRRRPPAAHEVFASVRPPSGETTAVADRRADVEQVFRDLRDLPELQRAALLMRELQGLSHAELGRALDTSVPAVKSLLVRARIGLANAERARNAPCEAIRESLASTHDRGVKPRAEAGRHLRECEDCRSYQLGLRRTSRSLAALVPAPLGIPAGLLGRLLGRSGHLAGGSGRLLGRSGHLGGGSGRLLGRSGHLAGGSGRLLGRSGHLGGGSGHLGSSSAAGLPASGAGPGIAAAGPGGLALTGSAKLAAVLGTAALLTGGVALEHGGVFGRSGASRSAAVHHRPAVADQATASSAPAGATVRTGEGGRPAEREPGAAASDGVPRRTRLVGAGRVPASRDRTVGGGGRGAGGNQAASATPSTATGPDGGQGDPATGVAAGGEPGAGDPSAAAGGLSHKAPDPVTGVIDAVTQAAGSAAAGVPGGPGGQGGQGGQGGPATAVTGSVVSGVASGPAAAGSVVNGVASGPAAAGQTTQGAAGGGAGRTDAGGGERDAGRGLGGRRSDERRVTGRRADGAPQGPPVAGDPRGPEGGRGAGEELVTSR